MNSQTLEKDEGRRAEDKSKHKGNWGTHSHADLVAEQMEPTEEQLSNAQKIINLFWSLDTNQPQVK